MTILKAVLVPMIATLWACASAAPAGDPVGSGHGQCAQRGGSYIARYVERQGNCGPMPEQVSNAQSQPTAIDPPCKGNISYTADNCEVTYDSTCPTDGAVKGGDVVSSGHSKWNTAATHGTATEQLTAHNSAGRTLCTSTYDVTLDRQ